jgi:similar to spore coat protein
MAQQGLAIHETLELHELLTAKTVCLTESKAREKLVQDPQLKTLINQDIQNSTQAVKGIQGLLSTVANMTI